MFEWLFSKKSSTKHSIGEKIRSIRMRKQISTADIADACQLTNAAIRHYENDIREPKEDKLQEIAAALGVDVSALYDRKIESITDIMHILFEIEADGYVVPTKFPVNPNSSRTAYGIRTLNEVLNEGIEKWCEKRELWETEQITDDEYRNWQDAFPQEYEVEVHPERKTAPPDGVISDYRLHALNALQRLRAIMMYDIEQVDYTIEQDQAAQTVDSFKTLKLNLLHNLDDEIAALSQEPAVGLSSINQQLQDNSTK